MKNAIVTGANGFIGSSMIKKLVENKVNVIALDISFDNSHLRESNYITKIETHLDDVEELRSKIPTNNYDAFFHFAWKGVNGADKADPLVQINNTQMAINCATFAKKIYCKKFLCAGTVAEQATYSLHNLENTSGGMMYGVAKHCTRLMLETYCKNIGLDFIWMQFSNIYGPNNKTGNLVSYTIGELINGKDATFGPALQPYDFIYVDDLIDAVYRLGNCNNSKNFYFIGSGEPRILKNYLFEIGKLMGKEDKIKIGIRPDDGIVYTMDMFKTKSLINDIGNYVSKSFSEGIRYTLKNY